MAENLNFKYNPAHEIGTCAKCGKEMIYNVPRLGAAGGFIHKDTRDFECKIKLNSGDLIQEMLAIEL